MTNWIVGAILNWLVKFITKELLMAELDRREKNEIEAKNKAVRDGLEKANTKAERDKAAEEVAGSW